MNIGTMEKKIRKARQAYYDGESIMSDLAFDQLVDSLRETAPTSRVLTEVGAKPAGSTGEHSIPMGSLKEAKTVNEMRAWMHGITGGFLVMDKVDGLSLSLDYEKGKLVQALTRGNGRIGEDVTANVRLMRNVHETIPFFTGTLRGEAFLPVAIFEEKYSDDYANPRNTAAGIVRRHSGAGAEDVALRYFYAKRTEGVAGPAFKNTAAMLAFIRVKLELATVASFSVKGISEFEDLWDRVIKERFHKEYEMDGVVVYVGKTAERAVGDPFLPDNAMVFKFEPDVAETVVTRIEHVAGRSGRVNPRVHVEPVKVGGVTVTHATGNNYPWLHNLGVGVGARVQVSRRGDTIPAVEQVLKTGKELLMPAACPTCEGPLAKDGAYLKCKNIECGAKDSGKVAHWLNLIEIKGVGVKMLEGIVSLGIKRPYQLYEQDEGFWEESFGANGRKIYKQLMSRKVVRPELILAAHVSNVGRRRFRAILDFGVEVEQILTSGHLLFEAVGGIGESVARIIVDGFGQEADNVRALLKHIKMEVPMKSGGNLEGWAVKFTGTMERKRKDLEDLAALKGARIGWKPGFRNVLVIADPHSQSTKANAARKAGYELMSEEDFIQNAS